MEAVARQSDTSELEARVKRVCVTSVSLPAVRS